MAAHYMKLDLPGGVKLDMPLTGPAEFTVAFPGGEFATFKYSGSDIEVVSSPTSAPTGFTYALDPPPKNPPFSGTKSVARDAMAAAAASGPGPIDPPVNAVSATSGPPPKVPPSPSKG